jgi:nucleotide-binding universal stress UspA family protein
VTGTTGGAAGPLLIGYDDSDAAMEAIDFAGSLLPGAEALVVTAWRPISEVILGVALGPAPLIADPAEADERQRRAAEGMARNGAQRASQAGLKAEPLAVEAKDAIWEAIERVARERDARLVVLGNPHHSSIDALRPDRVPAGLLHHGTKPVLVVPSAEAARARLRALLARQEA